MTDDKMREALQQMFDTFTDPEAGEVDRRLAIKDAREVLLAEAQQRGREIATGISKCVEKGDRMDAEWTGVGDMLMRTSVAQKRILREWAATQARPVDAPTDADRLREALTMARPYVEEATRRTFDGTIGPSMRNRAARHLEVIDAAMRATPADGGEG